MRAFELKDQLSWFGNRNPVRYCVSEIKIRNPKSVGGHDVMRCGGGVAVPVRA